MIMILCIRYNSFSTLKPSTNQTPRMVVAPTLAQKILTRPPSGNLCNMTQHITNPPHESDNIRPLLFESDSFRWLSFFGTLREVIRGHCRRLDIDLQRCLPLRPDMLGEALDH